MMPHQPGQYVSHLGHKVCPLRCAGREAPRASHRGLLEKHRLPILNPISNVDAQPACMNSRRKIRSQYQHVIMIRQ